MIRKAIIGTGAALVLGTFVFGRDVFSYMRTAGSSMRDAVKSEVPLDFEVQRARELVEDLIPDIRRCMHVIAEQEVDIERLQEDIARKEASLGEQKEAILTLRGELDSADETLVVAGRSYTPAEVQRDLSLRFERFRAAEETLSRDRRILDAREKALAANQEKLEQMLDAKKDLEVQVAQLEARLKTLEAAETVGTLEFDDSQLARAKKLIRDLDKQLDVKEKLLDADGRFTGLIPLEDRSRTESTAELTQRIDAYFGDAPQTTVAEQ